MTDCIFCNIVAGEIPSRVVYEDDSFLAFLDVRPLNPGHTLVIPKKHHRWVWDMENTPAYMEVCHKIANAQRSAFETDHIVSLIFGEEVPHAHMWLVPRHENDGHGGSINLKNIKDLSDEAMDTAALQIVKNLP